MSTKPESTPENEHDFARYVRAVATAVGVPRAGTNYDFSDTVGAYLALGRQCRRHPGQDLMLLWTPGDGWSLALENQSMERPTEIAGYPGGTMPAPSELAAFVTEQLDNRDVL